MQLRVKPRPPLAIWAWVWNYCRIAGRVTIAALLVAVVACGDSDPGVPDATPPPDAMETPDLVELGTGTTAWEPLTQNQELPLYAGPQGGHHFIVHARIKDMIPGDVAVPGELGNPITKFQAFDSEGIEVNLFVPPYRLGYEDGGDGWDYMASGHLLVISETEVDRLFGATITIEVYVTDAADTASRDSRSILVVEPEMVQ